MAAKPKVGCSAASADRTIYERQDSSRRVGCRNENPLTENAGRHVSNGIITIHPHYIADFTRVFSIGRDKQKL